MNSTLIDLTAIEKEKITGGNDPFKQEYAGCEFVAQLASMGAGMLIGVGYPAFPGWKSIGGVIKYIPKMAVINILNSVMVYNPAYE